MSACFKSKEDRNKDVELSSTTNVAVTCRRGPTGKDVKTSIDNATNYISIEGKGTALGSCPLDCDTAFWEVRVGNNPNGVLVGVKRYNVKKPTSLDGTLDATRTEGDNDSESWYFKVENQELKTGDVVGVYWDQTDLPMLSFSLNGKDVPSASFLRIRPTIDILPAVSVREGGSCEMIFDGDHFLFPPKSSKFKMIICATSLI